MALAVAARSVAAVLRYIVLLGLLSVLVQAHSTKRGALNSVSLVENAQIHTPAQRVTALSEFELTFTLHAHKEEFRLTLEPNHDVVGDDTVIEYLDSSGRVKRRETVDRLEHKVFKGDAWTRDRHTGDWTHVGWARIMIRRDGPTPLFEGVFLVMHDHHHIQMRSNYMQTKHENDPHLRDNGDEYMVVYRDSDYISASKLELRSFEEPTCESESLQFNTRLDHPVFNTPLKRDAKFWASMSDYSLFGKRQIDGSTGAGTGGNSAGVNLRNTIGSTSGCPNTRRVALVGVATDCTYTALFNSTDSVRANVITQFNAASDLYERTFNISLGLRTLTISDANCPGAPSSAAPWNIACLSNTTISDRLNEFSQWRGGRANDGNAYWTLLSTCNTDSAVGLAWLGQLCVSDTTSSSDSSGSQIVSGANVVVRTNTEWQVIAHETGHTFGAVHDCVSSTCRDSSIVNSQQCCPLSASSCDASGQYIMNPSTGQGISAFSPCSVGNICSALGRNSVRSTCLQANRGVTTISGSECGNGIVEEGEDCDCGGSAACATNSCCDARTCRFRNNAVCDDSNDDCCRNCQYASAGTVCRASSGVCDPAETCNGTSAFCPANVQAPNGQSCGSGLACASGQCTSRDRQCRTLMGSLTTNNDTSACDDTDCVLSCRSPQFGRDICYGMQQNFLDGTPCFGGGMCMNGRCRGSSVLGEAGSWIRRNKALVIGLSVVVGTILLFSFACCLWRSFGPRGARGARPARRGRRKNNANTHSFTSTGGVAGQSNAAPSGWYHHPSAQGQSGWYNWQAAPNANANLNVPQRPEMAYPGTAVRYA